MIKRFSSELQGLSLVWKSIELNAGVPPEAAYVPPLLSVPQFGKTVLVQSGVGLGIVLFSQYSYLNYIFLDAYT